jgi:hypothetical protein
MVGLLDAFHETWSQTRETFGQGTPEDGTKFDGSSRLLQMKSSVEAAAPDSRWQGSASDAYAAANKEHAQVYGKLADLDKRMAAEVTNAANVVTTGRQNLDNVKSWVTSMAASIPDTDAAERDRKLLPIVNKGVSQLSDIIQKSTDDMTDIRGRVHGIKGEYDALANQKFAPGEKGPGENDGKDEKKGDLQTLTGDGREKDVHKRAEQDVHDALAGNKEAAARVETVLKGIHPGQSLSEQEGAYLSQMQAQMNGMSVRELKVAEERLGDQKHIIGDAWQLMSNDDVHFPKTPLEVGALDDPTQVVKGGFGQLPESVQTLLKQEGLSSPAVNADDVNNVKAIAQIVRDGNPELQVGTELDREMLRLSDRIMDQPTNMGSQEDVVTDIFESAGRDHQVVHDHILGTHGDNGDDFLHDINQYRWHDDGKAAGDLFRWTNPGPDGSPSIIAAETAEKYANYLANHKELMHMPNGFSDTTLGQANPELVRAYAHGLTPYMADIASLSSADVHDPFDNLDPGNPERPHAKNLFAILSTDKAAYTEFNGAADALTLSESHQYAEDVKHHVPVAADDKRLLDAAVLKGLVAAGSADAAHTVGLNKDDALTWRKAAYTAGVGALGVGASPAASVALAGFGNLMESSVIGKPADPNMPMIPNMTDDESARFVLNALISDGVDVPGLDAYKIDGRLASMQEMLDHKMPVPADTGYQEALNDALNDAVGKENNPSSKISRKYEDIIKILGGGN